MTTLALLVGSNPLPNYLAARALTWERAVLFFTPQTEQVKDRLARLLQRACPEREVIRRAELNLLAALVSTCIDGWFVWIVDAESLAFGTRGPRQ